MEEPLEKKIRLTVNKLCLEKQSANILRNRIVYNPCISESVILAN